MVRAAILVLATGCNSVFGVHEVVELDAAVPDFDGDGIADAVDNCPTTPNRDQADLDGDAFGDACDRCPAVASAGNHDEDGDLYGDVCDVCPGVADFQGDANGDGVGDRCNDSTVAVTRLRFDPFTTLEPSWQAGSVSWEEVGDAVAPTAAIADDDVGLHDPTLVLHATGWTVHAGFATTAPWSTTTRFGVVARDTTGTVVGSVTFQCPTSPCTVTLHAQGHTDESLYLLPEPLFDVGLYYDQGALGVALRAVNLSSMVALPDVTFELVATPDVRVTYVDVSSS